MSITTTPLVELKHFAHSHRSIQLEMLQPIETNILDRVSWPIHSLLQHIGGGYETDVYRTDDRRYVVKIKREPYTDLNDAISHIRAVRQIAELFRSFLGPDHSLPGEFSLARDQSGSLRIVVVQPFLDHARPLHKVDFDTLDPVERLSIGNQLRAIVQRSHACYRTTGLLPDLYGVSGVDQVEIGRLRSALWTPVSLWNFLVTRTLLRSHNLLLTDGPVRRVVLVDYDLTYRGRHRLVRGGYMALRARLFWRDRALLAWLDRK